MACSSYSIQSSGSSQGINSNTTLADNLPQFSVSLWVNYTTGTDYQFLVGKEADSPSSFGWQIVANNPSNPSPYNHQIYFSIDTAGVFYQAFANVVADDGVWHNIVATYDSVAGSKIYFDGADATILFGTNPGNTFSNSAPVTILQSSGSFTYNYTGFMDEVRIWNSVLSSGDAATIFAGGDPAALPIAYWKIEEGVGLVLNDATGNGNTINLNSIIWGTNTPSELPSCNMTLTLSLSDSSTSVDSMVDAFSIPLSDSSTSSDTSSNAFSIQSDFLAVTNIPTVETLVNQLVPASVKTYFRIEE